MGYLTVGVLILAMLLFMALIGQMSQNKALISQLSEPSDKKAKAEKARFSPGDSEHADEEELSYQEVFTSDEPVFDKRTRQVSAGRFKASRPSQRNTAASFSESSKEMSKEPSFEGSSPSFSDVAFTETMMDSPSSKFDL